jgi:hypothetical protein
MIAALEKAQALSAFASAQGSPLSSFVLCLSTAEGLELLDWLLEEYGHNPLLEADVAEAKITGNPWEILANFSLLGLLMQPRMTLH